METEVQADYHVAELEAQSILSIAILPKIEPCINILEMFESLN